MRRYTRSNDAVSPVVGVMLMLVVTIIIAAVVSAFAGGVSSSEKKIPTVSIKGTYSQANGMTLTHAGGDTVSLMDVNFMTTPSETMGTDASKFAWLINKSIIYNPATSTDQPVWNSTSGIYSTKIFRPGDTFVINQTSCSDYWAGDINSTPWALTYGYGQGSSGWAILTSNPGVNQNARVNWAGDGKSNYFGAYAFGNPDNIGQHFYLDLVNSAGSIITRAEITITK